jgi:hypothetical protein
MIIEKCLRRVAAIDFQTFNQREPERTIIINIRFSGNAKLIPEIFLHWKPGQKRKDQLPIGGYSLYIFCPKGN